MENRSSRNHYYNVDKPDMPCPPGLESLQASNLFIVQQNICGGWFHSNKTYEVRDDKKQLLFKGSQGASCRNVNDTVILSNLRRRKIILLEFDSGGYCGTSAEATISVPADSPIGRVVKYGGVYAPPSFEIMDSDNKVVFTAEAKQNNGVGGLEYPIKAASALVAHVAMKSGLNFILNTTTQVTPAEKAMLLGFIIALDMLKHGKRATSKNDYEYRE